MARTLFGDDLFVPSASGMFWKGTFALLTAVCSPRRSPWYLETFYYQYCVNTSDSDSEPVKMCYHLVLWHNDTVVDVCQKTLALWQSLSYRKYSTGCGSPCKTTHDTCLSDDRLRYTVWKNEPLFITSQSLTTLGYFACVRPRTW